MLVLARRVNEAIIIGGQIKVTIVEVNKGKVKLGIEAPADISVHREEVFQEIQRENLLAQGVPLEQMKALETLLQQAQKKPK